ncbi:hypothetical protein EDD39_7115 [Kitasatospora cineracea]|uniref:Uncharacterized protein n=2 Tax=Kitasatospora cineracea TaxID=88074 RepID=A0A8G1X8C1_9ACTN|nr:hypothetical protein EDD39_7115 [Kitasatospora cineracea]
MPAMRCEVCGHAMAKWDEPPTRWRRETWECPWCRATATTHGPELRVSRSPYAPWETRWERAVSDLLPEPGRHAHAHPRRTLCGIERSDLSGSPFGMWGGSDGDCPACTAEALAVDARWPEQLREGFGDFLVPGPEPDPRDAPGRVPPPDELGHPATELPPARWSPHTRVLAAPPPGPAAPDPGHRTIGAGPTALRLPAHWLGATVDPYRRDAHRWPMFPEQPLDALPPLDEASFTGDYAWFGETGESLEHRTPVTDRIAAALAADGLALPADFTALITRSGLHRCLDRASGYRTDPHGPLPSPLHPDDRLVLLLREPQDCHLLYLYLHRDGSSAVVHSNRDLTADRGERYGPDGESVPPPPVELFWCAPSTEVFAYRFLARATLLHAIEDRGRATDLDPEHLAYLTSLTSLAQRVRPRQPQGRAPARPCS